MRSGRYWLEALASRVTGGAYGFAGMVPYSGGQAELLRVPYGDYNCLVLPDDAEENENDYVMLSDIFPTGFHATELAGVKAGDAVVVYGAGPVGLMAATSAFFKGASRVFVGTGADPHAGGVAGELWQGSGPSGPPPMPIAQPQVGLCDLIWLMRKRRFRMSEPMQRS
jgi:threonine dehydrogenase-like Zn-dependent dehydrogenase